MTQDVKKITVQDFYNILDDVESQTADCLKQAIILSTLLNDLRTDCVNSQLPTYTAAAKRMRDMASDSKTALTELNSIAELSKSRGV